MTTLADQQYNIDEIHIIEDKMTVKNISKEKNENSWSLYFCDWISFISPQILLKT